MLDFITTEYEGRPVEIIPGWGQCPKQDDMNEVDEELYIAGYVTRRGMYVSSKPEENEKYKGSYYVWCKGYGRVGYIFDDPKSDYYQIDVRCDMLSYGARVKKAVPLAEVGMHIAETSIKWYAEEEERRKKNDRSSAYN
jgi:hypothetical protein